MKKGCSVPIMNHIQMKCISSAGPQWVCSDITEGGGDDTQGPVCLPEEAPYPAGLLEELPSPPEPKAGVDDERREGQRGRRRGGREAGL